MTKPKDIQEALKKLDPEKADHWTSSGLPALDVVEKFLGKPVKRQELTDAAPFFKKDHPKFTKPEPKAPPAEGDDDWLAGKKDDAATEGGEDDAETEEMDEADSDDAETDEDLEAEGDEGDAPDTEKAEGDSSVEGAEDDITQTEDADGEDPFVPGEDLSEKQIVLSREEYQNKIDGLQREIESHRAGIEKIKGAIAHKEGLINDLYKQRDALRGTKSSAQATKEFIQRQFDARMNRAQARAKVNDALKQAGADRPEKAPIDAEIQRRNTHKSGRPVYYPTDNKSKE